MLFARLRAERLATRAAKRQGKWAEVELYTMLRLGRAATEPAARVFHQYPTHESAVLLVLLDAPGTVDPFLTLLEDPIGKGLVEGIRDLNEPWLEPTGRLTDLGGTVVWALGCIPDPRARPGLERLLGMLHPRAGSWDIVGLHQDRVRQALHGRGKEYVTWFHGEKRQHLERAYRHVQSRRYERIGRWTWGPIVNLLFDRLYRGIYERVYWPLFRKRAATEAQRVAVQRRRACQHTFIYEPPRGVRMDPPPAGKMVCTQCGYSYFASR